MVSGDSLGLHQVNDQPVQKERRVGPVCSEGHREQWPESLVTKNLIETLSDDERGPCSNSSVSQSNPRRAGHSEASVWGIGEKGPTIYCPSGVTPWRGSLRDSPHLAACLPACATWNGPALIRVWHDHLLHGSAAASSDSNDGSLLRRFIWTRFLHGGYDGSRLLPTGGVLQLLRLYDVRAWANGYSTPSPDRMTT